MGTLQVAELGNLLRLWANKPELLWGEAQDTDTPRYVFNDGVGNVFSYERSEACANKSRGILRLPDGRLVIVLMEREASERSSRLTMVRVSSDARAQADQRMLQVVAAWTRSHGVSAAVYEHRNRGRKRLHRAMRGPYGWSVGSATVLELVCMHLTDMLPKVVVQRARSIIGEA